MMPFVSDRTWRPPDSIAALMHQYVLRFVESAGAVLGDDGCVVVVVTSSQCLSWDLRQPVPLGGGRVLTPEVRWFDIGQVEEFGYQSRFGDGRDRFVDQPAFHRICDMTAVRWRLRAAAEAPDAEAPPDDCGVTDEEILERKKVLEQVGKDLSEETTVSQDNPKVPGEAG